MTGTCVCKLLCAGLPAQRQHRHRAHSCECGTVLASRAHRPCSGGRAHPASAALPPASHSYTLALGAGGVAAALFIGGFVVKSLQED